MSIQVGDIAPAFEGEIQDGSTVKLSDYKGKKLILFFYPKDNTPGCSAEACNLSENYNLLKEKGFELLGVSPDSIASHNRFIEKKSLAMNLLSDPEKEVLQKYDAWGEKKLYGRVYDGVLRSTVIINEEGVIEHIFKKVKTKAHTEQILEVYKEA